jgi:hypothetical protein
LESLGGTTIAGSDRVATFTRLGEFPLAIALMQEQACPQKITFGEMRQTGVRGLLILLRLSLQPLHRNQWRSMGR